MSVLSRRNFTLTCFLLFCLCRVQAQHLNIRSHQINQALDIPTVYHSLQDAEGFRWFGTETGVVRFDGKNYRRYTMEHGLSDNEVLKIFEDKQKRIWFLTFNGHLSYFYQGRFYNKDNSRLLQQIGAISTFAFVYQDQKGGLLFSGGQNKVLHIGADNRTQLYNFEKSEYPIGPSIFFEDSGGQQYLACNSGFYYFNDGQLRPASFRYFPEQVRAYYAPRPNELYFIAREGLVYMRDTTQQLLIPAAQLPAGSQANHLFIDSSQRLWIETIEKGLHVRENFRHPRARFKPYLQGAFVSSISEDKETNVWFTTSGEGVYILPANSAQTVAITQQEGLSGNKINAISQDGQGNIWLGLDKGKVARYRSGQLEEFDVNFWNKYNRVTCLLADRRGDIWCGTDLGIVQLKRLPAGGYAKIKRRYHLDDRNYAVKSIQQNKAGEITFVQSAGIEKLREKADPEGYFVARIPQVERMRTYTHFYGPDGQLWFANIKGLHHLRPDGGLEARWSEHPALTYRITSMQALPQGVLALATYGHGIVFLKKGRFLTQMTRQQGLTSNICRKIFVRGHTVWVATNEGLNRFSFANDTPGPVETFRITDGLLSDDILDVLVDQNQVYVGTSRGLNILPNLERKPQQPAPPIQLTAVTLAGRNIRHQLSPQLPYFQNRIQFEFIGITFQDPKTVSYQYRLTGNNAAWTTTQNTLLEFSALQPGTYTFEVKAQKQNSAWSAPVQYTFTIAPPFWQTWWFRSLLAVLVMIVIGIGVKLYIAIKLRQQWRRLETEYRVQQERERIARDLHDNVGSSLAYIINSLEEIPGQENHPLTHNTGNLREYTKHTISQLRETIWAIRQETISVRELGAKIQKLIWQNSAHLPNFGYEVNIEGDEEFKLTPVQALNLFRIAQEAVNNALKHSRSESLLVTLKTGGQGRLHLLVADKGQGFDAGQPVPEDHYGLLNMRDRARELGGQLTIQTAPGQGTQIGVDLDLR